MLLITCSGRNYAKTTYNYKLKITVMKKTLVMAIALMFSIASMAQTEKKPMKKNKMNTDSTHMMHHNMSKDSMNMNKNSSKKMKMKSKSTKMPVDSANNMN